jgi:hypothetical protein
MIEDSDIDQTWEAGFDADRAVIVSRLGFYRRIFPKPRNYVRRFHHEVVVLPIEDWTLPVPRRELAPGCLLDVSFSLRFQPTVRYASQNAPRITELGAHVRSSHLTLLLDSIEEELRALEQPRWLTEGCASIERAAETAVQELLALRDIQSRARCAIHPNLEGLNEIALDSSSGTPRYRALQLELLRRQRALAAEAERQRTEQEQQERERRLAVEREMLRLAAREEELRRAHQNRELEQLKTQLAAEERLQAEQRYSDERVREEQIRHEARLRDMELEIQQQDHERRTQSMDGTEDRLKREIELLALERQRLLLEEEIRDIKLAKAKGWIVNAKRRFSLGKGKEQADGEHVPLPDSPDDETE